MLFKIIIFLISILFIILMALFVSKSIYRKRLKAVLIEGKPVKKMNFELIVVVLSITGIVSIIMAYGTTVLWSTNKTSDYIIPMVDSYNLCATNDEFCLNYTRSVSNHLYQVASGDIVDDNYIVNEFEDSNINLIIGYKLLPDDLGYNIFYYIEYKGEDLSSNEWLYLDNKTCYTTECDYVPYRTLRIDQKRIETYYVSELPKYFSGEMKLFILDSQVDVRNANRKYVAEIEYNIDTSKSNLFHK